MRKLHDPKNVDRYSIVEGVKTWWRGEANRDFCIGKVLGENRAGVKQLDFSEIERILKEVTGDIPNAKILLFSREHKEHGSHSF